MPAERYYHDTSFQVNSTIEINGAEFHHLAHVMRTRKGDQVEIVNGKGILALGTVKDILKDKVILLIDHLQHEETKKLTRLILAQAVPKGHRLDLILEKGTELGIDEFWIFPGKLSVKKEVFAQQLVRANQILISAMKQCGRLSIPLLKCCASINQWKIEDGFGEATVFFGDLTDAAQPLGLRLKEIKPQSSVIFVTGPEAGFELEELQILKKLGAEGVKLHPNILRTETASIVAMSLLSHWQMCVSS